MRKRTILSTSVIATLIMIGSLGALAVPVFADSPLPASDAPKTTVVNGVTWVEVSKPVELEYIDQNQGSYVKSHIELMNDINMLGYSGWVPFGGNSHAAFSGTFNGQGHEIQNLAISDMTGMYVGFFGVTTGTVENVGVDATVEGLASTTGTQLIGGLVGYQDGGIISDSYASGIVSGGLYTGGLVGYQFLGTINDSYASGAVSGSYDNGGLVGYQEEATIRDSFASGAVSRATYNGGLLGYQGYGGAISASFFDTATTGMIQGIGHGSSVGVTGEPTSLMQTPSIFINAGWSTSHWQFSSGQYPELVWQQASGLPGQMPEVPFAGTLPAIGLAGVAATMYVRKRRGTVQSP